ncbi:MAG: hypothetical protein ACRDKU_02720 [Gaiellaceae bacterium]
MAALLRVREHLLEYTESELSLAGSATCERGDVVLDRCRTDLVERDRAEDVEVRQDVADARERRGTNAQGVALEPAGGERTERLRRRLVQRAERSPRCCSSTNRSASFLSTNERERARPSAPTQRAR